MKLRKIVTDQAAGALLKETEAPALVPDEKGIEWAVVNLYPELQYQEIYGFGGAFTEAAGYAVAQLPKEQQERIIEDYFGESGIGYNLCRTHINSCDFALGNYAYVEDADLSKFSIARDKEYLIPLIKAALAKTDLTLMASPWSPPAFMKDTKEMNHGGKLLDEYKQVWADYLVKYVEAYRQEGINIDWMTVQNEPNATQTWDSCRYTGAEEAELVKNYLGPTFEKAGIKLNLIIWDHNKERVYERAKESLADPEAAKYIWGIGFHWYTGTHFEALELTRQAFPDKPLIFTEGCVEYSRHKDRTPVDYAEQYGHDILGDLNGGMSGYMDWNLVLDAQGGPNHVKNFCDAPIMTNDANDGYRKNLSYYYIGHFSKYIKKGARRIAHTRYTEELEVTAFRNPDGTIAMVVLNRTDREQGFNLRIEGQFCHDAVAPHSIVTYLIG